MRSNWDLSDIMDDDQKENTDSVEFDVPASRSYDWEKRATKIKQRDNYVCQRCGDHNGNYEQYPLAMEAHHLVPGKYLPKPAARVELNLIAVCESCHGSLEGSHIEWQLAEIGRDEPLQLLQLLKEQELTPHHLSRKLDISEDRVRSIVSQLERMNCVAPQAEGRYRTICPAKAKSLADRAGLKWKKELAVRQSLAETLTELRQAMTTGLDELEYALETGNRNQAEAALGRLQDTLTTADPDAPIIEEDTDS